MHLKPTFSIVELGFYEGDQHMQPYRGRIAAVRTNLSKLGVDGFRKGNIIMAAGATAPSKDVIANVYLGRSTELKSLDLGSPVLL